MDREKFFNTLGKGWDMVFFAGKWEVWILP